MFKELLSDDKLISTVYQTINQHRYRYVFEDQTYRFDGAYVHWFYFFFYLKNMICVMTFFNLALYLTDAVGYLWSMVIGAVVFFVLWFALDVMFVKRFLNRHIVLVE